MLIVFIVLYCLIAAAIVFGLSFHGEMSDEEQRARNLRKSILVIRGGGRRLHPRA